MTTPTAPVPGYYPVTPRTWSAGDQIEVPRLRADAYNLAAMFAQARPMMLGQILSAQSIPDNSATVLSGITTFLNTWNVPLTPVSGTPSALYYPVPLAGWYLLSGYMQQRPVSGGNNARYVTGVVTVANGGTTTLDFSAVPWTSTGTPAFQVGGNGLELVELNSGTSDYLGWYAYNNNSAGATAEPHAYLQAEWVALPGGTLSGWTGPAGTVVASPQPAAAFPPGPGVTLAAPAAAGAGTIVASAVTGMVAGGNLGLDYLNSVPAQPYAEVVTISTLPGGGTVTFTPATSYAHATGAPVAVPVSAAFLNQQVRDQVNYLTYPPILRAVQTSAQSIPQSTFPSGTKLTSMSATASKAVDNFSGFASNSYTVPVSGIWLVYGLVYYTGSTATTDYGAGIAVNAGTIQWGDFFQADTSGTQAFAAGVRRELRLTAGQTVALYGFQNSGSAMNTVVTTSSFSKLIMIWRAV